MRLTIDGGVIQLKEQQQQQVVCGVVDQIKS
jgi:hypothetical protein